MQYDKIDESAFMKTFKQSELYKVCDNLDALRSSFLIFKGNYNELIEWLESFNDYKEVSRKYDFNTKSAHEIISIKTNRLLYNFLSSASSLIYHTRKVIKALYSSDNYKEFKAEYETKLLQELKNNPLQLFIK